MRHLVLTALAQALQSATSFLTTLAFVNLLAPASFGLYAAILSVWMIFLSAHRAVLGEQLIAGGTTRAGYVDFVATWGAAGLLASGTVGYLLGGAGVSAASVYCALFVVSDALRYEQFARPDSRSTLAVAVSVEGCRLVLSALAFLVAVGDIAPPWVAVAGVVLSGLVWPLIFLRDISALDISRGVAFVRRLGRFEGAMSIQFLLGTGTAQAIPLLALAAFGPAAFGHLKLAQSLVGPIALLGTATSPGLVRLISATKRLKQWRVTMIALLISGAAGSVLTVIWVAGLFAIGPGVTPMASWESAAELILPCAASMALVMIGQPGSALLRVRRYARVAIRGQTVGVCATLILCSIAVKADLHLFAWAMVAGSVVTVSATYILLIRDVRRGDARG